MARGDDPHMHVGENVTWWDVVAQRAAATPDSPLLFDDHGRTLSCAQFAHEAEELAAGLAALGVSRGSRISWQLPTTFEAMLTMTALARLGAYQNPLILGYREREIGFALQRTRAEFVVTVGTWKSFDHAAMIDAAAAKNNVQPRIIVVNRDERPRADCATLPPIPPPAHASAPSWTFYTTGTTSEPKGVLHSDATLLAAADGYARRLGLRPTDITAIPFSVAHIGGPDNLGAMLIVGFPALVLERFDPAAFAKMAAHGVTVFGGVAFGQPVLDEQSRQDGRKILPDLRLFVGGGGPTLPQMRDRLTRELGVTYVPAYGMTEIPMITVGHPTGHPEALRVTDGAPIDGLRVRIVDNAGGVLGRGEVGEVQVSGSAVMRGYADEALNKQCFSDGWFRTGDLGSVGKDGSLTLSGRLKDVVIRKGENVSAREIEDLLATHPGIEQVAVIGVPDDERGEMVCAVVTLSPGANALALDEVGAFLSAAGLARYKLPERLEIVDEMPVQGAFLKVSKPALRRMFTS